MSIEDVRKSFKSCIETGIDSYIGRYTPSQYRQIADCLDLGSQQSDIGLPAFRTRLLHSGASLIDVEKIKTIATACFTSPLIHCFFDDTAPTGPIGKKIWRETRWNVDPNLTFNPIRKAFLKKCLQGGEEFERLLDAECASHRIKNSQRDKLRQYPLLCGRVDAPARAPHAAAEPSEVPRPALAD